MTETDAESRACACRSRFALDCARYRLALPFGGDYDDDTGIERCECSCHYEDEEEFDYAD